MIQDGAARFQTRSLALRVAILCIPSSYRVHDSERHGECLDADELRSSARALQL